MILDCITQKKLSRYLKSNIGQLPRVSGKDPERKEWTQLLKRLFIGQLPRVSGEDP